MGSSAAATPWTHLLLSSIQANSHLRHHSYFQLATISSNSRPSNRTVVFRGFQDDSDKILINTDTRSRKIDDLKHCSFAEICWYFTESWEQFRISGSMDVIDGTNPDPLKLEQREKSWFGSSAKSRLQYMGPAPGFPAIEQASEMPSLDPCIGPVPAFCLLLLDPHQVDYLNLKKNERLIFSSQVSTDGEKLWTREKRRRGRRWSEVAERGRSSSSEVVRLMQEHLSNDAKKAVARLAANRLAARSSFSHFIAPPPCSVVDMFLFLCSC